MGPALLRVSDLNLDITHWLLHPFSLIDHPLSMPSRGPTTFPPPATVDNAQSGVDVDPTNIMLSEFHDSFTTCYNLNNELTKFDDTTGPDPVRLSWQLGKSIDRHSVSSSLTLFHVG